jgi:hypothetical protein
MLKGAATDHTPVVQRWPADREVPSAHGALGRMSLRTPEANLNDSE